jgi:glycosyltransferase involved in cell wall biosynthesis
MIKKRILFVAPLPPPMTGQSIAVLRLYEHIREFACVRLIDTSKKNIDNNTLTLVRFFEVLRSLFRIARSLSNVDKIYFNCSQSVAGNLRDILIYIICWNRLPDMVIHLHGGAGMRVLLSECHPILRSLNRFFLVRVGAVIVLGESLRSIYNGIVLPSAIHVAPNFADDQYFTNKIAVDLKFASPVKINILFLSNHISGKGYIELLEALNLLPDLIKEMIHVDFAGGFESDAAAVAFKRKAAKIDDVSVNVHNFVTGDKKRKLLSDAHLFCLPTYYAYEGQPVSMLEAYASGCAVMTTNHSGIFDIFSPMVNGIEVEKKSAQSISDGIVWAVNNIDKIHEFSLANLHFANENYHFLNHVKILEELLFN